MIKKVEYDKLKNNSVSAIENALCKGEYTKKGSLNKNKFHGDINEAGILDLVNTIENVDVISVEKREEPDFVMQCNSGIIAVEVRKVNIDSGNKTNNQYARWKIIKDICTVGKNKLDKAIYGQKVIRIKTLSKLFDISNELDVELVINALLSVITGKEVANDYWADAEICSTDELSTQSIVSSQNINCSDENEVELMQLYKPIDTPLILPYGNIVMQRLTEEHIKNCISDKEGKLPIYKCNLKTDGYLPSQYWLILDIPNDLCVDYNLEKFSVESTFDRVYLVDMYYKRQILRLK